MMRDHQSLFQTKNNLGYKMKRSMVNFCSGEDSTSILNQHVNYNMMGLASSQQSMMSYGGGHNKSAESPSTVVNHETTPAKRSVTLEEMILQLELEEEMARKEKLRDMVQQGRRSCVNNADILRSARNALNQYPRFSLDGRDAMYRNFNHVRSSGKFRTDVESSVKHLPSILGGERVLWCKPGVVARLMGLEAVPVPLFASRFCSKEKLRSMMKRQSLRQMAEWRENERKKRCVDVMELNGCGGRRPSVGLSNGGSCSRTSAYCVMKPVAVQQPELDNEAAWRIRRYR